VAAALVAVLAAVGALAGLIWSAWDNGATRGLVYTKTAIIPDQTEGFISTDGRFVVITGVIGLVAGSVAWLLRAHRGPTVAAALVLGGLAGALLTDVVGRATGGGTDSGTVNTLIARLPLRVHAHGILVIEAILALAVYVTCAMVARPDDLGVPAARGAPAADDAEGADVATSSVGSRLDP
jgi:hypothetical protein